MHLSVNASSWTFRSSSGGVLVPTLKVLATRESSSTESYPVEVYEFIEFEIFGVELK